jgi:hypothetical protein
MNNLSHDACVMPKLPLKLNLRTAAMGRRVTNGIDTILKVAVIVAVTATSSALSYYYIIYLPLRDAQMEAVRQTEMRVAEEKARQEIERAAALERAARYQQEWAKERYRLCVSIAEQSYSLNWDTECERQSTRQNQLIASCISEQRFGCQSLFDKKIPAQDCALPKDLADQYNTRLKDDRDRCMQEYRDAIQ